MSGLDRRTFVRGVGATGAALSMGSVLALAGDDPILKEVHTLKAGEFVWHPERSPEGPVAIIVSLPDQLVHVYRNGVRIAVSTCSTGRAGHTTPTGVFTILEKAKTHFSSTYDNAPMPNMNRLTWNGVALHAGNLPGYPASHGCIRLPMKFSELLFTVTHVGTPVVIAGSYADPTDVVHPGLVLSRYAEREFAGVQAGLKGKASSWQATVTREAGSTSVVVSSVDSLAFVIEDGDVVAQGKAVIKDPGTPLGSHVYVLSDAHDGQQGMAWQSIGHTAAVGRAVDPADTFVIQRISADKAVIEAMRTRMHPGMVLVTTDLPAHAETRSGRDFVIMTQGVS